MEQLSAFLEQQAAADQFSGAAMVARDEEVLFARAYRLASKAFGAPNKVDTRFNLGSMNKMLTAVAIAQLAERGRLAFDDPVGKHLPDYPREDVAQKVTIHHLLTHTAGLGSYWNDRFEAARDRLRSVNDYLRLFVDDPLLFEPGERAEYSNAGYIVLGAILERVTGRRYDDYVHEHIYEPAGMRETEAYALDCDVPNLAIGYTHQDPDGGANSGAWRNNLLMLPARGGPAGGGYSTVEDLLRFASALRRHRLLSPQMTATVLEGKVALRTRVFARYGYGFGSDIVEGVRVVGHSGGAPGINGQLDMYPDLGYTVAVLANYDPPAASQVAGLVREMIGSGSR
jgi:CubicO group peptidase (beta-lactamase class C family)